MRPLIFLIAVTFPVHGIDVVLESLKQLIDKTADPCENFYRHVCPLNSTNNLMINMIKSHLKKKPERVWDQLEIYSDTGDSALSVTESISKVYKRTCENGGDIDDFLGRLVKMFDPKLDYCVSYYCFEFLKYDPNCERSAKLLRSTLGKHFLKTIKDAVGLLKEVVQVDFWTVKAISDHIDENLEDGIEETKRIVERMKEIVAQRVSETPWTINNNVTDYTLKVLEMTSLKGDYGKQMRDSFDRLIKNELEYRKCKQEFGNEERSVETFCFTYVAFLNIALIEALTEPFFELDQASASNLFPFLQFSLHFYYLAKNTKEMAAKLGSLGFVVGHEVSHTLIKGPIGFEVLTYFSMETEKCIQNQYNATCNEFKEESCEVDAIQLDENGADILGIQLAYKMLEEEYGDRLFDIYEPLNVTYQQLFFYSTVPFLCKGERGKTLFNPDDTINEHSPNYIRINSMANHPAFKEAFKCSDDSRMMRSAPVCIQQYFHQTCVCFQKQCVIYGEGAPQNKLF